MPSIVEPNSYIAANYHNALQDTMSSLQSVYSKSSYNMYLYGSCGLGYQKQTMIIGQATTKMYSGLLKSPHLFAALATTKSLATVH